jgi:hypothetical protein
MAVHPPTIAKNMWDEIMHILGIHRMKFNVNLTYGVFNVY